MFRLGHAGLYEYSGGMVRPVRSRSQRCRVWWLSFAEAAASSDAGRALRGVDASDAGKSGARRSERFRGAFPIW